MTANRFNEVLETLIGKCASILGAKDRLHNFKIAAELQNCTPITALAGMMAKPTICNNGRIF